MKVSMLTSCIWNIYTSFMTKTEMEMDRKGPQWRDNDLQLSEQ